MRHLRLGGRQAASLFCVAMGLFAMVGLGSGHAEWLRLIPYSSIPVFNAALLTLLGARLVWHDPREPDGWTLAAAALLVVVPLLIMAQTLLGIDLGLDWPALHAPLSPDSPHPGRVSPNACLGFMACGLAVVLQRSVLSPLVRRAATAVLVHGALLIALSALVGYVLDLEALYRVMSFNKVSVFSSIVLLTLAGALWHGLLAQDPPARYQLQENRITGTAVAVLSFLALLSGVLTFGVLQAGYKDTVEAQYGETAKTHATAFAHSLEQDIEAAENVATQLAVRQVIARLNANPRDPQALRDVETLGDSLIPYGFSGIVLETADSKPVLEMGEMRLGRADVRLTLDPRHVQLFWDDGLVLRSRTPIRHEGRWQGTLETETRLTVLTDLLQDMQRAGRTTDVLLCGRLLDNAVCMPSRLYATNVHIPIYPGRRPLLPVGKALLGMSGTETVQDLRGVRVQAGYAPLDTFNLALVIKTDIDELYAPLRTRLNVVVGLMVLLVALGTWLLRARVHPLTQQVVADQRRMRAILATSHEAFVAMDARGRIADWNDEAERTFGWSRDEALGQSLHELLIPEGFRQAHKDGLAHYERTGLAPVLDQRLELTALRRNGELFPIEITISRTGDTGSHRFAAFLHDITERRRDQTLLADQERRLRTITDNLPVLISYIDRAHCLRFTNGTFRDWLGVDPEAAVGRHLSDVVGPALYEERRVQIDRALAGERLVFEMQSHALGVTRHLQTVYVPDLQPDGSVAGIYTLSNDVTALKAVEHQLRQLARVDTLTRLANRLQFDEKLPEAMARSRRDGRPMALMFLDIDKFKGINDTLGHAAGDEVLKEFALRLGGCVRQTDTVARLAGDEFVIVLEGLKGRDEPDMVARKIIATVNEPFIVFGQPLQVSTSLGIVLYQGQDTPPAALLAQADEALYRAKADGRNTHRWAAA